MSLFISSPPPVIVTPNVFNFVGSTNAAVTDDTTLVRYVGVVDQTLDTITMPSPIDGQVIRLANASQTGILTLIRSASVLPGGFLLAGTEPIIASQGFAIAKNESIDLTWSTALSGWVFLQPESRALQNLTVSPQTTTVSFAPGCDSGSNKLTYGNTVGIVRAWQFSVLKPHRYNRCTVEVTAGGTATDHNFGIYRDGSNGTSLSLGALVMRRTGVSAAVTGVQANLTWTDGDVDGYLQAGNYWFVWEGNGTGTFRALPSAKGFEARYATTGAGNVFGVQVTASYSAASRTGLVLNALNNTNPVPLCLLKAV